VLIRALEPVAGLKEMARARGLLRGARLESFGGARLQSCRSRIGEQGALAAEVSLAEKRRLTTGPGRLSQAMGITRTHDNGKDLTSPRSGLWLADDGFRPRRIARTPRVGIQKAAAEKLRYILAGSEHVSG